MPNMPQNDYSPIFGNSDADIWQTDSKGTAKPIKAGYLPNHTLLGCRAICPQCGQAGAGVEGLSRAVIVQGMSIKGDVMKWLHG